MKITIQKNIVYTLELTQSELDILTDAVGDYATPAGSQPADTSLPYKVYMTLRRAGGRTWHGSKRQWSELDT